VDKNKIEKYETYFIFKSFAYLIAFKSHHILGAKFHKQLISADFKELSQKKCCHPTEKKNFFNLTEIFTFNK